jgi:16S rRNA (guanine966-N2)-methyltransferase
MGLKIVTGNLKGRKLRGPRGQSIRPATAKLRESVFQILGDLHGKRVLDLFAGTGSMGLEALSRSADECAFVDSGQQAISLLFHNLKSTGLLSRSHIVKKPATGAIEFLHRKNKKFDLIFLDPPYDRGYIDRCLRKLAEFPLLAKGGILVCEHSPREIPSFFGGLEKIDQRKYGQTLVSFLKEKNA